MSAFQLKFLHRGSAPPLSAPSAIYDNRFGTDATTAAATGWFTFALHSGNRRIWVDSVNGNDSNSGLSAALAKATFEAAYTLWQNGSFLAGDQLMVGGNQSQTYTNTSASNLTNKAGISATYPTCILSYDSTDPSNSAKYGKLMGVAQPHFLGVKDAFSSFTGGGTTDNIAVQGMYFDGQDVDGGGSVTIQSLHNNVVYQNCAFNDVQLTINCAGAYDATAASYGQAGNISKCIFYGPWDSGANIQGIYIHGTNNFYIQDNAFLHCGWRIGSCREDSQANGGANAVNHGDYVGASNAAIRLDRNFYMDTSADGLNLRSNGFATSNVSIDEPMAGNLGGFSGGLAEAPTGVLIQVDDWLVMGSADIASGQQRGQAAWTTNTIAGSYVRKLVAFDSPKKAYGGSGLINCYNTGNSQNISSITNVGTLATLTTASAHGLSTGQHASVGDTVPAAYTVTDVAITVTGANTFTYTMLSNPGGSASTVGNYTAQVPQSMLFDQCKSYNYSANLDSQGQQFIVPNAITNTWTNCITDQLAPGGTNQAASSGLFPSYKTRDQVITTLLSNIGITPGATYFARKSQLANLIRTRPDLPWALWTIGIGFPAMGVTSTYAVPSYTAYTDTPITLYPTSLGNLTLSTLNFTHGVSSSATITGVSALPLLSCADLPSGLTITGRVISGSAASAGTPTIHVVETTQDGGTTHTTALTLNIS